MWPEIDFPPSRYGLRRYALFTPHSPAMWAGDERTLMRFENPPLRTIANQDGAAILDPHSGQITTLNTTAAYVWHALQRGDDTEVIARNLAHDTEEDLSVVRQGVASFLAELEEQRLWPR